MNDVIVGEKWSINLPPGKHPDDDIAVLYFSVELGNAKRFVDHDIDAETLSIE